MPKIRIFPRGFSLSRRGQYPERKEKGKRRGTKSNRSVRQRKQRRLLIKRVRNSVPFFSTRTNRKTVRLKISTTNDP